MQPVVFQKLVLLLSCPLFTISHINPNLGGLFRGSFCSGGLGGGGGGGGGGGSGVHSTLWKSCLHFVYIFRKDENFLIKFCSFDPIFIKNIFRSLYLKYKTSAHVHTAITCCFVLFTNFLT